MERFITTNEEWTFTIRPASENRARLTVAQGQGRIYNRSTLHELPHHVQEFLFTDCSTPLPPKHRGVILNEVGYDEIKTNDYQTVRPTMGGIVVQALIQRRTMENNPEYDGINFDEYGFAADSNGASLTDPYEHITWAIGSRDDFHCFDAAVCAPGLIAVHSVINSETGSFIMTGQYEIVSSNSAEDFAESLCSNAEIWCMENGVRYNKRNAAKTRRDFVRHVKNLIAVSKQEAA